MQFDTFGFAKLPSPLTVNERTYAIVIDPDGTQKNRVDRLLTRLFIESGARGAAIVFRSPGGAQVEVRFSTYDDSFWRHNVWIRVNDIEITAAGAVSDTEDIADPTLRQLVETALTDLMTIERANDPTGRHAAAQRAQDKDVLADAERERALRSL